MFSYLEEKRSKAYFAMICKQGELDSIKFKKFVWNRKLRIAELLDEIDELRIESNLLDAVIIGLGINNGALVFFTKGLNLPQEKWLNKTGFIMTKRCPEGEPTDNPNTTRWRWEFNL